VKITRIFLVGFLVVTVLSVIFFLTLDEIDRCNILYSNDKCNYEYALELIGDEVQDEYALIMNLCSNIESQSVSDKCHYEIAIALAAKDIQKSRTACYKIGAEADGISEESCLSSIYSIRSQMLDWE